MTVQRTHLIQRSTNETQIELELNLDGTGSSNVATGVGFLDHMLVLFARHGLFDLRIEAHGDLEVDHHHTVEDVGICLGMAIRECIGDKAGIRRYGSATLPMDETLATVALDLGGRPFLIWNAQFSTEKIGTFDTQLIEEFWRAVSSHALMNFHTIVHHGSNSHHISEAIFKAASRALRTATEKDDRVQGVPSTKGTL